MPRTLSAAVLSAIASKTVGLALFVELAFADNTFYVWGGIGSITPPGPPSNPASSFPYGSTFTGLGWLGKVSTIPQSSKVQAQNITLALSGIPSSLTTEAVDQVRITGHAMIWLGFFDTNKNLLEDPVQLFAGALDVPSLTDAGNTSMIAITCENPLISLNLAPNRQFDDADQQLYYPGDLGFGFVELLANVNLFWPAPDALTTPYQIYMTVTPASSDIAVGGTVALTLTVYYSDGSHISGPAGVTSGTAHCASSNPEVATVDGTSGIVTGRSPGTCNIIVRVTTGTGPPLIPSSQFRAACSVVVHS